MNQDTYLTKIAWISSDGSTGEVGFDSMLGFLQTADGEPQEQMDFGDNGCLTGVDMGFSSLDGENSFPGVWNYFKAYGNTDVTLYSIPDCSTSEVSQLEKTFEFDLFTGTQTVLEDAFSLVSGVDSRCAVAIELVDSSSSNLYRSGNEVNVLIGD